MDRYVRKKAKLWESAPKHDHTRKRSHLDIIPASIERHVADCQRVAHFQRNSYAIPTTDRYGTVIDGYQISVEAGDTIAWSRMQQQ